MTKKYFGTDGIRGLVGVGPITPEFCLRLGYALGVMLAEQYPGSAPGVLIGKDTRVSGYMLESALEAGLIAAGAEVYLAGPIPTPAVAYLTRSLRLQAGIVISASHNPYHDNGLKFFGATGHKLSDELELAIEAALLKPMQCVGSDALGKAHRVGDAQGRYIEFCKNTLPAEMSLRGLKIVVDCAHGAGYQTAPKVLQELGAEVVAIGVAPDGFNINRGVGATDPKALSLAVLEHKADLGIALDGDADRLIMVGSTGEVFDGDQLLHVLAVDMLSRGPLKGVAGTLMTNLALEQALAAQGVPLIRANVGDRYVMSALQENGWQLGGETSGHVILLDRHTSGDGLVAALAVLAAVVRSGKPFDELAGALKLCPSKLINVRIAKGFDWKTDEGVQAAIAQAQADLAHRGRLLIRASGTEPLLRVMTEGEDASLVLAVAERLAQAVRDAAARVLPAETAA